MHNAKLAELFIRLQKDKNAECGMRSAECELRKCEAPVDFRLSAKIKFIINKTDNCRGRRPRRPVCWHQFNNISIV